MLRRTLAVTALLALTGCASSPKHLQSVASRWQGQPVAVAVAQLGKPSRIDNKGEVRKEVKDPSSCTDIAPNGKPYTSPMCMVNGGPRKWIVVDPGTGEKLYRWEQTGVQTNPQVSSGSFSGSVNGQFFSGYTSTVTGYSTSPVSCSLELTVDPATGTVTHAELHGTIDAKLCPSVS